jgi:hypothetical protein
MYARGKDYLFAVNVHTQVIAFMCTNFNEVHQ